MADKPLPPLTWLRAFEASARHLSFTRAASELNMTQSAISQHVRALEGFLGRALFVRKTRAIELTEAGGNYLPIIREAFDLLSSGTQAFIGADKGRTLTVQCNLSLSVYWLAPRLPRLYARHPWLVLNILAPIWDPERHAAQASVEIRFGRAEDMSAAAQPLTKERYYPVCHPGFADGAPDIDQATLLDCAGLTGSWASWCKGQGHPFARSNEVTMASSFTIIMEVARHHGGLAMTHDSLARDLLAAGALMRPFEHAPVMSEAYFLLSPPGHSLTPAARAFMDWLYEMLDEQPSESAI